MLKWNTMKIRKVLTDRHENRKLLIKSLFKELGLIISLSIHSVMKPINLFLHCWSLICVWLGAYKYFSADARTGAS